MKKSLNDIAEAVIEQLSGKVVIHRYDSYSTNSIYLKFDYGVANSLRISDHNGKKHLRYRFNILESMRNASSKKRCTRQGLEMFFYGPHMVNACCRDILLEKRAKEKRYRSYEAVVETAKQRQKSNCGFWGGARLVQEMKRGDSPV